MRTKLLILLFLLPFQLFATPPVEEGKTLFMSRCASCHNVNKQLVGPALAGVHERRSIDWIVSFVASSQSMIKDGDKDAIALFEKFNKVPMPDHTDLDAEKIKSIVEYIKAESKPVVTEQPINKPPVKEHAYMPLSLKQDWLFFTVFIVVVGLLIAALSFAVKAKSLEKEAS